MALRPAVRCTLTLVAFTTSVSASSCGNSTLNGAQPGTTSTHPPYPAVSPRGEIRGETNFADLMRKFQQGRVKNTPWAGNWWPFLQNGTSQGTSRYESARGENGATTWEIINHGPSLPGVQSWWGHCNGWAVAAVLFREPREPVNVGGVNFGVAEQKQLLSEIGMEASADFFGLRNESNNTSSLSFRDVFPNQFFLVLTNIVGNGIHLIMDRYTGDQVWNHPITGYRIHPIKTSDYLGPNPLAPGVFRVMITTELWWTRDDVPPAFLTSGFEFADNDSFASRLLRYEVWLDAPLEFDTSGAISRSGKVILAREGNVVTGGFWRNGELELFNSHPDYLWMVHGLLPSNGFSSPRLDQKWIVDQFAAPVGS